MPGATPKAKGSVARVAGGGPLLKLKLRLVGGLGLGFRVQRPRHNLSGDQDGRGPLPGYAGDVDEVDTVISEIIKETPDNQKEAQADKPKKEAEAQADKPKEGPGGQAEEGGGQAEEGGGQAEEGGGQAEEGGGQAERGGQAEGGGHGGGLGEGKGEEKEEGAPKPQQRSWP